MKFRTMKYYNSGLEIMYFNHLTLQLKKPHLKQTETHSLPWYPSVNWSLFINLRRKTVQISENIQILNIDTT